MYHNNLDISKTYINPDGSRQIEQRRREQPI